MCSIYYDGLSHDKRCNNDKFFEGAVNPQIIQNFKKEAEPPEPLHNKPGSTSKVIKSKYTSDLHLYMGEMYLSAQHLALYGKSIMYTILFGIAHPTGLNAIGQLIHIVLYMSLL